MPNRIFNVSDKINIPKYKQIINSLCKSIQDGLLTKGDKIPSINALCKEFSLSRDTVLVAFNELKAKGIISSVPGKGYYVSSTQVNVEKKIFLLFEEFNAFKEILYNSFIDHLKSQASVDIYFHHFNRKVFKDIIDNNNGNYTSYVIMPAKFNDAYAVLKSLPQEKVIILDQTNALLAKHYPAVYQNFEKDVYQALNSAKDLLSKYKNIKFVFPGGKEPIGQIKGFKTFAAENEDKWSCEIISNLNTDSIHSSCAYIIPSDVDLVTLVKYAKEKNLSIGTDIGIVSYNDTPLKEVVADGITTISTDFHTMGRNLAEMILLSKKLQLENPAKLIRRNSL